MSRAWRWSPSASDAGRLPRERGLVAVELVAALAFVLVPVVLLAATLPSWVGRRHAAVVAAGEAARDAARTWPEADTARSAAIARRVMENHGVAARDVRVSVTASAARGGRATARVAVRMPAVAGTGRGSWWLTVSHSETADLYRSRE